MKSDGLLKHMLIAFAAAAVLYVVCFAWIEHRREFKGPWTVTFLSDSMGAGSIAITEEALHITQKISFPNEKTGLTNFSNALRFDQPITNLPFGQLVFQDPTFLPGTLTMNFFRHEVELLPRTLVIDKKEYPWQSGSDISITEPGKIEPKPNTQYR